MYAFILALTLWTPLEDGQLRLAYPLFDSNTAELQIKQGVVSVQHSADNIQTLLKVEAALRDEIQVQLDDLNFDGYTDIAIASSYGYMGVNIFSTVFIYDASQARYEQYPDELSNISLDVKQQRLLTGTKSGPRYYTDTYDFVAGNPYKISQSVMLLDNLEKTTFYNHAGEVVRAQIFDSNTQQTAVRPIQQKRAYLYHEPNDENRSKMYIVEGDSVELLDSAGTWDDWLLIRYQGKQVLEMWIKTEALGL